MTRQPDRAKAKAKGIIALAAAIGLCSLSRDASAQTWTSPSSGLWSNAANWTDPPIPGASAIVGFNPTGAQTYTATNDLPGPFMLSLLNLTGGSTGSITIDAGSLSSLHFASPSPQIFSGQLGVANLTGRIKLNGELAIDGSAIGGTLNIAAALTGPASLTFNRTSSNAVILGGANSFTGVTTLNAGRLELGHQDALGAATLNVNGGLLATSLDVTPSGSPPHRPVFTNPISGGNLNFGGTYGFTLAGPINLTGGLTFTPTNTLDATWSLTGSNAISLGMTLNGSSTPGLKSTLLVSSPAALGNPSNITINGAGAQLLFGGGSTPVIYDRAITTGALGAQIGAFSGSTLAQVTLSNSISGVGTIVSSGNGVLTLAATNTFSGPLALASGITAADSDVNLGGIGSTISLAGGSLMLGPAFGSTPRNVNVSTPGSTIYAAGPTTFSGIVSNSVSSSYTKSGPGALTLTGANTFNHQVFVQGGTLAVGGASGRFNNATGSIVISDGAAMLIDNTAAITTRLVNTSTVTLNGGDLHVIGNNGGTLTANGTIDVNNANLNIGTLNNSGAGHSLVTIDPTATGKWRVRFDRLNRTANAGNTVRFVGTNIGNTTIVSTTLNASNFIFDNAPILDDGIIPWAVIETEGSVDFPTYDATNGLRRYTAYAADLNGGTTSNAALTSIATTVATTAVNSLKLLGGTIDTTFNNGTQIVGSTLEVQSGAVLVTGSTVIGTTANVGTLQMGINAGSTANAPTGLFHTDADLTILPRVVTFDAGGLLSGIAKTGNATLNLAGSNTYAGPTRILEGTLRLQIANGIPAASQVFLAPGATLDLNGFNSAIGSLDQTGVVSRVSNQPSGTVLMGAGMLTAGGDNNFTTISHNLIGTGTFQKNGTGSTTVVGSQAFTGTVNINNGGVVLGTHLANGTGFANANRIRVGIGTAGGSGDVTLAFDFGLRDGFAVPISVTPASGRQATIKFSSALDGAVGVTVNSSIDVGSITGSLGLIIDSSGGTTLAGPIAGTGRIITTSSEGALSAGPDGFSLNFTGNNTYSGPITLGAISTLFGHANAFGNAVTAVGLGSTDGDDQPEMASSAPGLTFTRPITVNNSLSVVPSTAFIGSRSPGPGTTTYSGAISIAGSRTRLILFSQQDTVQFTNVISGGTGTANLEIGRSYGPGLETTRSNVILSGQNTYQGGTKLVVGTLGLGTNTVNSGTTILSGPVGRGALTIGTAQTPGGAGPTIMPVGGARTLSNPVIVNSNFVVAGANTLTLTGTVDLTAGARVITVDPSTQLTIPNPIVGVAGSALIKEGGGTLLLSNPNVAAHSGPTVVGGGTLVLNGTQHLTGMLAVADGATAQVAPNGARVIVTPSVYVDQAPGSRLDLTDNAMIVDYTGPSPAASILATVKSAYASNTWTGRGITSSLLPNGGPNVRAIGVTEASAFFINSLLGEPVDSTSVLVRYTFAGDANVDGLVNITDLGALATFWQQSGTWWQGDSDYSGFIDITDLGLLATNWQQALPGGPLDSAPIAFADALRMTGLVPEPASAALVLLGFAVLGNRRRR